MLRYRETGKVHLDFHRTTNGTIRYLRKKHGLRFLDEVLRHLARDVYRAIRQELKQGSAEQLVQHWRYFFGREQGKYRLERKGGVIRMNVLRCPAVNYLLRRGIRPDPAFCRQTVVVNAALAEGTSFAIETEVLGPGRCVQTIRRRAP